MHSTVEVPIFGIFRFIRLINVVQIASGAPELHSGVEGGAAPEPMFDMYVNSSTLLPSRFTYNPGFAFSRL